VEGSAFAVFARRKEDAALSARFERFETVFDNSARFPVEAIGCPFTDALLDGPFFQSVVPAAALPVISVVFVQSVSGNTDAEDPAALGGGDTDKHVIYEGLSRVSADAVMAGANTVRHGIAVFSVWHPELVALRRAFEKPRHPVQIVVTSSGELAIEDGLLFNIADVRVVILTANRAATSLAERTRSRPWITVISSGNKPDLRSYAERLFSLGIRRVSAVGGRKLATGLIDSGLVSDLYLTTSPIEGGSPSSRMYEGTRPPSRDLVIRKRSSEGIVFEHFIMRAG
jgi:5-amino-6-(5-phosphoribosylamino)uracil reductase